MKITLSRSLTINTGNYQSIRPSVDLTIDDVPLDKAADVYIEMTHVIEGMLKNEVLRTKQEIDDISKSLISYCSTVEGNLSKIGDNVESSLNEIQKLLDKNI